MFGAEYLRKGWKKLRDSAEQLYTPKELRSILFFVGLGVAVLLYRSGTRLYRSFQPPARSSALAVEERNEDSLFRALSAVREERDSLFFSLPEDSLLPRSVRQRTEHHSKEESLQSHAIVLNTATKEDLMRLPAVGPATAELILAYRNERGFRSLDELENVHGIGHKRFLRMERFLRLQ